MLAYLQLFKSLQNDVGSLLELWLQPLLVDVLSHVVDNLNLRLAQCPTCRGIEML